MIISTGIIIAFFTFILLCLLSGVVVVFYLIGKRSVRNDPNKALILIKNGLNIKQAKGKLHETAKKGLVYSYDKDKFVIVPKQYHEVFVNCKRLLFIGQIGQLIASPFDNDVPITDEEATNLIYEMCSTHIGADGMRALKGKSTANIIIIAIIAFAIGMVVVLVFNQMQSSRQTVTTQQQQQQPSQTIIQEKK